MNAKVAGDLAEEVGSRIDKFKASLLTRGAELTLNDYILKQDCSILGKDTETKLRARIADYFHVKDGDVVIVGSAKLGFSPKPGQYFKHFSAASDIDVAILSKDFFAKVWMEVFEMERSGTYFNFNRFRHYHYQGWIRPDKLPYDNIYATCRLWWEFFNSLSASEDFQRLKVSGGLYFDEYFLRHYQLSALVSLREQLLSGKLT